MQKNYLKRAYVVMGAFIKTNKKVKLFQEFVRANHLMDYTFLGESLKN
ncbi:hypothetical protein GCM10011518_15700 [Flavobacterium limi]|uniref:Uncharacterized protein n=1 Tax=Flavobacterium limi TaxID=2045105 RepID=A0ABQ1TZ48_9FLAO|nr:hypothetical protein GCM10011518_15700 [Flavobacterium limi]